MKIYKIYLESFCEDIFQAMEDIQDGDRAHIIEFIADNKDEAIDKITNRLREFLGAQLQEVD